MNLQEKINQHLEKIYTAEDLLEAKQLFVSLLTKSKVHKNAAKPSEETAYLITYGDSFRDKDRAPLSVLREVVAEKLPDFTDIHILPMFPYTSDDGFSVVDYLAINPELGTWQDVENLAQERHLMFDFVCNHLSKSSDWFQQFLSDADEFKSAFISFDENFDSSKTTRPRTSPLFTEIDGKKVWTTFSADQVDTNAHDPKMLARLTEVLLEYVARGASSIRLDAIGFLWKQSGTTSMHLPQTHEVIKLWRTLLDALAPNVQIITETNVPHADNISYFGNGTDEANMVYQFPLPPLVLHSFISGNSSALTHWAKTIKPVSDSATYFNFLASHDGIGLRPTEGILTDEERERIAQQVLDNGGKVSYKNNPDGSQSPYELNINYLSALGSAEKLLAAHAILLSFLGVPAIYYHSIFGSRNDLKAVQETGIARRINREKLDKTRLYAELESNLERKQIYEKLSQLLKFRKNEVAFNPYGNQKILDFGERVFALKREYGKKTLLSIINISDEIVTLSFSGLDIITQTVFSGTLNPYQYVWISLD
ncbi:alpha-amylase family glycosyl hydrolase [Lactococcus allomyrinae]|uniref:Sucrose phosphorylase n=1 Tax=Lactococcus allomyrinae TaxID=2419773 RepID=A0A387BES2_9LACT|nr:alpha-amylase family glycosyl hydrolase [Lactococcus allomyrinae]AYG00572.1 alpha-amylase [Lactococcus allomyrinae]